MSKTLLKYFVKVTRFFLKNSWNFTEKESFHMFFLGNLTKFFQSLGKFTLNTTDWLLICKVNILMASETIPTVSKYKSFFLWLMLLLKKNMVIRRKISHHYYEVFDAATKGVFSVTSFQSLIVFFSFTIKVSSSLKTDCVLKISEKNLQNSLLFSNHKVQPA